jgi:hypothetical protein
VCFVCRTCFLKSFPFWPVSKSKPQRETMPLLAQWAKPERRCDCHKLLHLSLVSHGHCESRRARRWLPGGRWPIGNDAVPGLRWFKFQTQGTPTCGGEHMCHFSSGVLQTL